MHTPTCSVCNLAMETGVMLDRGDIEYGQRSNVGCWCPGEPKEGFWKLSDLTGQQVKAALRIKAYRCPKCARLELFAPDAAN